MRGKSKDTFLAVTREVLWSKKNILKENETFLYMSKWKCAITSCYFSLEKLITPNYRSGVHKEYMSPRLSDFLLSFPHSSSLSLFCGKPSLAITSEATICPIDQTIKPQWFPILVCMVNRELDEKGENWITWRGRGRWKEGCITRVSNQWPKHGLLVT